MTEPQTTPTPSTGPDAGAASATPPVDVEALIAKAKAATPGEWKPVKGISPSDGLRCGVTVVREEAEYLLATIENGAPGDFCDTEEANAAYIVASQPRVVIFLCEEIKRLRASSVSPAVDGGVLSEALAALEKAATEVAKNGARVGPQWPRLSLALIQARAALAKEQS